MATTVNLVIPLQYEFVILKKYVYTSLRVSTQPVFPPSLCFHSDSVNFVPRLLYSSPPHASSTSQPTPSTLLSSPPSGFGFVTFEDEEPAEKVCSIQYHDIKGKKVEVKVAQTKEALAMQQGRGRLIQQRNYSEVSNSATLSLSMSTVSLSACSFLFS